MILSLDQSIASTGFIVAKNGTVFDHGVIVTKAEKKKRNIGDMDDKCRRINYIISAIHKLIKTHKIKAIVCEEYAGYSQSKSAADGLATSRTIIVAISNLLEIPMIFIPAVDAKEELTGKKSASKLDMIEAAAKELNDTFEVYKSSRSKSGWDGKTEHVADAYGIYLAARKNQNIQFIEKQFGKFK